MTQTARPSDPDFYPTEFDIRSRGHGLVMRGWDFTRTQLATAAKDRLMLNVAFELGRNVCSLNCPGCFTEDASSQNRKHPRTSEMSVEARLRLIDATAELGTKTVNFVGAGEPTLDPNFYDLVERIGARGMRPVIFTEGSRLTCTHYVSDLKALGTTVVIKVHSLRNRDYQNAAVGRTGVWLYGRDYFDLRGLAIQNLLAAGFTNDDPTRLAFDIIAGRGNLNELTDLHRWCRVHNIMPIIITSIPIGRGTITTSDSLTVEQTTALTAELSRIDREEFGIEHRNIFPYGGGVPCTIRGFGVYVKIDGQVTVCPGNDEVIGNVMAEPLADIWTRAKARNEVFTGRCPPRENTADTRRHLPIHR